MPTAQYPASPAAPRRLSKLRRCVRPTTGALLRRLTAAAARRSCRAALSPAATCGWWTKRGWHAARQGAAGLPSAGTPRAQPGHVPIGSLHSAGTPRQAVSQSRALSQAFGDCQAASRALRTLPRLEGPQGASKPRIALRCSASSRRCIITCSIASSSRRRLMLPLPSWARTLAAAHVS